MTDKIYKIIVISNFFLFIFYLVNQTDYSKLILKQDEVIINMQKILVEHSNKLSDLKTEQAIKSLEKAHESTNID